MARRRASSRPTFAARNRRGRQSRTTPAFSHSPRSTRGTTRTTAYWNLLRGRSDTFRLRDEQRPRLKPGEEIRDVGPALGFRVADDSVGRQPVVGNRRDEFIEQPRCDEPSEPVVGGGDGAGERQEDVLGGSLERPPGM